jgi:dihydrolipoyl dehydrogenase
VGCIPTKALLRNAELEHLLTREAKTFGIKVEGEVSFDYGEAFRRSRKVADGRVKGVHFLMKKNKITEISGRGTFLDPHTLQVADYDGNTRTVRGVDPRRGPAAVDRDRRCRRDRRRVRVCPAQLRCAGHDRGVPGPDRPAGGVEVSAELAKQYRKLGIQC